MQFQPIDNPRLLTEAQRKSPAVIRPPALVRHVALWNPVFDRPSQSNPAGPASFTKRLQRRFDIDEKLAEIFDFLNGPDGKCYGVSDFGSSNRVGDSISFMGSIAACRPDGRLYPRNILEKMYQNKAERAEATDLVTFKFRWWGILATLRFELHTEYLTITTILDLSGKPDATTACAVPAAEESWSAAQRAHAALLALDKSLGVSAKPEDFASHHEDLFEKVWLDFEREVMDRALSSAVPGKLFVDFRCLVLGISDKIKLDLDVKWVLKRPKANKLFLHPFWREPGDDCSTQKDCTGEFWEPWRQLFWPLMIAKTADIDFKTQEFTVTRMLKGRALHVTALGALPENPLDNGCFPLRTLYLAHSANGYQLGRLVDRMNHQGTTRLAAVMEYHDMRVANYELRQIEQSIRDASAAYFHGKGMKASGYPASHGPAELAHQERMEELLQRALIGIEEAIQRLNDKFSGGIEYRVGRARYYIQQFFEGLPAVRPKRLQGFQPYEVFVRRRIGGVFDFIELLGDQYTRMLAERALLFRHFQAQQAHCVELRSKDANVAVERLQRTAEYALVLVLVPYYLASIIVHGFALEERSIAATAAWVGVWGACMAVAARRFRRDRIKTKKSSDWIHIADYFLRKIYHPVIVGVLCGIAVIILLLILYSMRDSFKSF